jgi:hypothetical protein
MPHLQGYCRCGKPVHWPKNSTIGDKWRCYSCGFVITLVASGTPGAKPTTRVASDPHAQRGTTFRDGSSDSYLPKPGDRFCAAGKDCACGLAQVCIALDCDCSRTKACADSDNCSCGRQLKVCTNRGCSCSRPAVHTAAGKAIPQPAARERGSQTRPLQERAPQERPAHARLPVGRGSAPSSTGCGLFVAVACCVTAGMFLASFRSLVTASSSTDMSL